jgi:hypothetical protein
MNLLLNCTHAGLIRRAPLIQQKQFLAGPPPSPLKTEQDLITRDAANVADGYAEWALKFLLLPDEFIAHVTKCAPYKRLPRKWSPNMFHPGESFCRLLGDHRLWVRAADHGWLIEREHLLDSHGEQILAHPLLSAPVLCPTYPTAARLAEACYPEPGPNYQLVWHRI